MKVLYIADDRRDGPGLQDMFSQTLLYGLARSLGTMNVDDWFRHWQYRGAPYALQDWPVFLGSLSYYGKPENQRIPIDKFDVQVINVRFLSEEVIIHQLCSRHEHRQILDQLDTQKLILTNSTDDPAGVSPTRPYKLWVERPGRPQSLPESFVAHISVPMEWVWFQMAKARDYDHSRIRLYAAMGDNGPVRRELMEQLAASNIPDKRLRWGSATGYAISGTLGTIAPPSYLRETQAADMCVSVRGCNQDCLRTSEILALGSLLISDDPGWSNLEPGTHYLRFSTPEECLKQIWWAIDNPDGVDKIALAGHMHYLQYHTPEKQAVRILRAAGIPV